MFNSLLRLIFLAACLVSSLVHSNDSPVTEQEYELIEKEFNALGYKLSKFGTRRISIMDQSDIPWGLISATEEPYLESLEVMEKEVGKLLFTEGNEGYLSSCYENYKGAEKTHLCVCFLINRKVNFFISFLPKNEAAFYGLAKSISKLLKSQ